MKFIRKARALLLVIPLVALSIMTSLPVNATDSQSYPESINGLPVIFVKTSENTVGFADGRVTIVLLDSGSASVEESLAKSDFSKYLSENPLLEGWSIEVYGGPDATKEEFEKVHEKINDWRNSRGPIQLGVIPSTKRQDLLLDSSAPTFAVFTDEDPGGQTVAGLKVQWEAPTVGDYQSDHSAFMINGKSDEGFFLQSGQLYAEWQGDGYGWNGWSTSDLEYYFQEFSLSYYAGHEYEFEVSHLTGTGYWWISGEDLDNSNFDYEIVSGDGTELIDDPNTSLFFENWNTNSNWYQGFSNPISAYSARDYQPDQGWSYWSSGSKQIYNCEGGEEENDGIITGSILNNGTGYWWLDAILLSECE